MYQNHNIANYRKLSTSKLTATATSTSLYDLVDAANPNFKKNFSKNLDAFRVYVLSGTLGIMLDGSPVAQDTYIGVEETQHFIENCDLNKVQFAGIGGDAEFVLQVSHIG